MKLILTLAFWMAVAVVPSFAADYEFHLNSVDRSDPTNPIGEFVFTNKSSHPLEVFGIGEAGDAPRKPAFVEFEFKLKKTWKSAGNAGFGETAGTVVTLAPGEGRKLQIPLRNLVYVDPPGRVGLRGSRDKLRLWSDPIDLPALEGEKK